MTTDLAAPPSVEQLLPQLKAAGYKCIEDKDFAAADAIRDGNAPENFFTFVQRLRHRATIKPKHSRMERILTWGPSPIRWAPLQIKEKARRMAGF